MELKEISDEALRIKKLYAEYEKNNFGRNWSKEEMFIGMVSDIGDLSRLVLAQEGVMKVEKLQENIEHEISDLLWSVLVLANEYGVNIEEVFLKNMKALEERIRNGF
jgi:NTP pyrophosphatase (non-canonical NTP hydrolase)